MLLKKLIESCFVRLNRLFSYSGCVLSHSIEQSTTFKEFSAINPLKTSMLEIAFRPLVIAFRPLVTLAVFFSNNKYEQK